LNNLVTQINNLNFFGDEEVNKMISAVRSKVARLGEVSKENRDIHDIQNCLRDIAVLTRSSLVDLGETPRSARSLGVPDVPTADRIRTSRQSLGINELETEELGERTGRRL